MNGWGRVIGIGGQYALAFLAGIALRTIVGDGNGLLLVAMLGVFVALVALTYVAWSFAELWRLWRGGWI